MGPNHIIEPMTRSVVTFNPISSPVGELPVMAHPLPFGRACLPIMKIRKMTEADKPKWLELRIALWPDCPTERHSLEMEQLQHSDGIVLLAED